MSDSDIGIAAISDGVWQLLSRSRSRSSDVDCWKHYYNLASQRHGQVVASPNNDGQNEWLLRICQKRPQQAASGWSIADLHHKCWRTLKPGDIIIIFFLAHQHKAAGVKTKQNVKQRLRRLLIRCSLCWGRRPHSLAAELWTGVETGKLFFFWCPGWWLGYVGLGLGLGLVIWWFITLGRVMNI